MTDPLVPSCGFDTEAYASAHNDGFDAAVAQELQDHPEAFAAALRAAADRVEQDTQTPQQIAAQALRDAAKALSSPKEAPYEVWASGAGNWLRERADLIEGKAAPTKDEQTKRILDVSAMQLDAEQSTCPKCRHAAHGDWCPNMASDNDCSCTYDKNSETA